MDKKFLTAFILPEYFDLMGFKLKPFCARTLIALHAANSPFVTQKKIPEEQDILDFLRICSADFKGFFNLKNISWFQKYFYFKMKYAPIFKARVIICIKMYVEDCCATPLVRVRSDSKVPSKKKILEDKDSLPELLITLTFLMSKLGISEDEALDMPIGRAACYCIAFAALEGTDIVMVNDEKDEYDEIKQGIEMIKKVAAEKLKLAMDNGKIKKRKINII